MNFKQSMIYFFSSCQGNNALFFSLERPYIDSSSADGYLSRTCNAKNQKQEENASCIHKHLVLPYLNGKLA